MRSLCLVACCVHAVFIATMSASAVEPKWQAIPLITQAQRSIGQPGGEGGQAIRSLCISWSDPSFLIMGTDVGGIYRSLDAGAHWQVCMTGWNARGGNAFAIDPKNADHLLGVGANGNDFGPPSNGVYLSLDRGASWKQVLARNDGNEWRRDSLAFDPASYDRESNGCRVAYFESREGGLFKSIDAGRSWKLINKDRTGAALKLHPTKGFIYLADNSQLNHGFYKSSDAGISFRKINDNYTLGIDVIPTRPDSVYISRWDAVLVSDDCGESFRPVGKNAGLPANTPIQDIRVSPADPRIMACRHGGKQWWEAYSLYSHDGGDSWHKIAYDNTQAFLPFTSPDEKCAFHPTNAKIVYNTAAGGWVVKSQDGGKTYAWCNAGSNTIMAGGGFNFSVRHPDALYLSFQDFAGAMTLDSGKTWRFCNAAGNGWGGFDYGGFTPDAKTLWCGDAPSWTGPRTLKISRDGGTLWSVVKDAQQKPIVLGSSNVGFADPSLDGIFFAANYRSEDAGQTWTMMADCDGVYSAVPTGRKLYGAHVRCVWKSIDHGKTWKRVTPTLAEPIRDVAVDATSGHIYAVSADHLNVFEHGSWSIAKTPTDQYGQVHINSVTLDPTDPSIVYAGGAANLYATTVTVIRSIDAGKSWVNLTPRTRLTSFPDSPGPHEVQWLRVHPISHELWVNGECFGMWKLGKAKASGGSGSSN